jgi:hypothetical protein
VHPWGFVIVRHVQSELTSQYWHKSYQLIRKLYPDVPIVVIDDNSNPRFLRKDLEVGLVHCKILSSEYPQCGEMLGYYYFLKHHWFEKAVVLHDSVFLLKRMDFTSCSPVKFLWYINDNKWDDVEMETQLLSQLGGPYLELYTEKTRWKGCFGVMSVIDYAFVKKIACLFVLMDDIKTRRHRSCMERIFAVACFYHHPSLRDDLSLMGDIHQYILPWGFDYQTFVNNENRPELPPLVKVWTGR